MFFGKKKLQKDSLDLIGSWQIDPNDIEARKEYGDVKMIFNNKGSLTYEIREHEKLQIIKMTFVVDGNFLITDQESSPNKEKTEFLLLDERLVLIYGNQKSTFIKMQ